MVILGNSPADLQQSLNRLNQYCTKWGLEVNTSKSKVVVFRSRGNLRNNEKWTYGNEFLEVVDNLNYLGVCFNYTGSFNLNVQNIKGKSLKVMHLLYNNVKIHHTKPDISMQLFDTFVGSIINYACPVWGFTKSKDLAQIHLKYCKWILGVKNRTCNAAVYGELGRYPIYISRYVQIIKYWLKLMDTDNIILQRVCQDAKHRLNRGFKEWLHNVQHLLSMHGFSYAFDNPQNLNVKTFPQQFKQRLIDCFQQKWNADLSKNEVLKPVYLYLKQNISYEPYLNIVNSYKARVCLTKLRISAHNLNIEWLRYGRDRKPRSERLCYLCNNGDIEDEFHFVLKCSKFQNLRRQFIKKYYYKKPSMFKFVSLLRTTNRKEIMNLGNFLLQAFEERKKFLA